MSEDRKTKKILVSIDPKTYAEFEYVLNNEFGKVRGAQSLIINKLIKRYIKENKE